VPTPHLARRRDGRARRVRVDAPCIYTT